MTDQQSPSSDPTELDDVDESAPSDDVATVTPSGVARWNLAENMTGIILAAAAILVLAGAAAGIIGILQSPSEVGGTQGQVTGTVIASATSWSGIGGAVLLFLALALLWHLANSSTAAIDVAVSENETEFSDGDRSDEEQLREALQHFGRTQTLTSVTTLLLCLNVIAAIAAFVGIVIEGGRPSFDLRWEQYIMGAGICVATLVLLVGGLNVIRSLNARFASVDIGFTNNDLDDDGMNLEDTQTPSDDMETVTS